VSAAIDRKTSRWPSSSSRPAVPSSPAEEGEGEGPGRHPVDLYRPAEGSTADILLEDGDRLEVPKKTNVVNVVGRVYNPTASCTTRRATPWTTISKWWGPTESADQDHIFLLNRTLGGDPR